MQTNQLNCPKCKHKMAVTCGGISVECQNKNNCELFGIEIPTSVISSWNSIKTAARKD